MFSKGRVITDMAGSAETERSRSSPARRWAEAHVEPCGATCARRAIVGRPNIYQALQCGPASLVPTSFLPEPELRALLYHNTDTWTCRVQRLVIA